MKLAYRSTNWIVLAGGIVEVRCDPGGATRRRREPSPLHQGARRRVEVVVARGTGDREPGHRGPMLKATPTTPLAPRARAASG
jgi:hypothetical protein